MSPKLDWREVWRRGIAPQFSRPCLEALRDALATNDPRLFRGGTVEPEPTPRPRGRDFRPPTGGCALGFALWQGMGLPTVEDVLDAFCKLCHECEMRCGGHATPWVFTGWFDATPPAASYPQLLREVNLALAALPEGVPA